MLVAILILLCLLFFFILLILSEVVLIKRRFSQKQTTWLPQVKPEVLRTLAQELDRVTKSDRQSEEGQRWADEFFSEQPTLAHYLGVTSRTEDKSNIVSAVVVYRLLKAQAEADNLADLTKIQK